MCDCGDMFCSGCKPIVTKKEVPSTLIITTYTCPTCKNSSRSQTEIQKCIKSHLPKPEPKYKVGDCVRILHYPGDYGEYDNGIITEVKLEDLRELLEKCRKVFMDLENECKDELADMTIGTNEAINYVNERMHKFSKMAELCEKALKPEV